MTDCTDLIAAARAHLEGIASANPPARAEAMRRGEIDDERLSLVARLADALEAAWDRSIDAEDVRLRRERLEAERDALRRKLDAVRDLHAREPNGLTGDAECAECSRGYEGFSGVRWPCPTLALLSTDTEEASDVTRFDEANPLP